MMLMCLSYLNASGIVDQCHSGRQALNPLYQQAFCQNYATVDLPIIRCEK